MLSTSLNCAGSATSNTLTWSCGRQRSTPKTSTTGWPSLPSKGGPYEPSRLACGTAMNDAHRVNCKGFGVEFVEPGKWPSQRWLHGCCRLCGHEYHTSGPARGEFRTTCKCTKNINVKS